VNVSRALIVLAVVVVPLVVLAVLDQEKYFLNVPVIGIAGDCRPGA
jgi:hypothetical protein